MNIVVFKSYKQFIFAIFFALLFFITISQALCFFSPLTSLFKNKLQAQTGSYIFTAVAVTGSQGSSAGGRVQINGGTISGEESLTIPYFTSTTVQAYANTGYEFTGWYTAIFGGQLKTRNATFTFHMPSENTTFYAIFTINRHNISVASSPSGAGNITGAGSHNYGTNITISSTAINSNYEFYRYIENSVEISNNPNYSFTVTENRNLVAEFRVKLSVEVVGGGSVTVNTQQGFTSGYFLQTQNVILEANPQDGYEFVGWSSASVSTSPTIQVIVGTVAKTYVANFSLIGAYLFVNSTTGGSVAGTSEAGTYAEGQIINLVANANTGFHFLYWQGEFSGSLQINNPVTSYVVMLSDVIRGNIALTAVFERDYVNLNLYATVNDVITGAGGLVKIGDGQSGASATELLLPEIQIQIAAIKQNGYKFAGWYTSLVGGQLLSQNEVFLLTVPIEEVSYYAVFRLSYWHEYRIMPEGTGSIEDPYVITSENELAWLAYATNTGLNFSSGLYAKLTNHLNLAAYMWEPIGNGLTLSANSKWQGNFDGGGYIITNLNINKQQNQVSYSGLFGGVYGSAAKIINLGLQNVNIFVQSNYNSYIGAVAGQTENGTISACYVKELVINAVNTAGNQYVGGLVGANTNAKINNCYVFGGLTSNNIQQDSIYLGGLIGNNYGTIASLENCYSVSSVQVSLDNGGKESVYAGAIVGYNSFGATVKNCYYSVEDTAKNLIGTNNATIIESAGKTKQQLKQFATYVNENSNWNFELFWFMPNATKNEGIPILRGIGNLIVNSSAGENGSITPAGQAIYYYDDNVLTYVITPNRGYRIKAFTVNDEPIAYYNKKQESTGYAPTQQVGVLKLEVEFEVKPKEPIDYILLALLILTPTVALIYVFTKLFRKKLSRHNRIKGAIKNYKKNRERFFKFRK